LRNRLYTLYSFLDKLYTRVILVPRNNAKERETMNTEFSRNAVTSCGRAGESSQRTAAGDLFIFPSGLLEPHYGKRPIR